MFSQKKTNELVDQVVVDHAVSVLEMKKRVEEMWVKTSSKRERRSVSTSTAPGVSLYGDNIGTQPFYNFCSLNSARHCIYAYLDELLGQSVLTNSQEHSVNRDCLRVQALLHHYQQEVLLYHPWSP